VRALLLALVVSCAALAQTAPSYFSTTGARYSYYDKTLTETTNFGVRIISSTTTTAPSGLWAVMSVDATPRSQSSSAALRLGFRYFLKAGANGNLILHAQAQAGAATVPAPVGAALNLNSLLANFQGGVGLTWRACHSFSSKSTVNCVVDFDYDLNSVTSQAVKPLVGLFVGLAF
jgi:hypothetical protein